MMNARTLTLSALAVAAVLALAVLGSWRFAEAHPDADEDGVVDIDDVFTVVAAFGQAFPTPAPAGPVPVEEQNVDGSGFIKVHEQGVADVNVVSLPTPQGAYLLLHETLPSDLPPLRTSFVDTSTCTTFIAMAKPVGALGLRFLSDLQYTSPDGSTSVETSISPVIFQGNGGSGGSSMRFEGSYPHIALRLDGGGPPNSTEVWLFCR